VTRVLVPALARPLVRTLAAVLLLVGAGAALAGPAAAHVSLTGTTPAAGSQVDAAPTQVELTYSAALLEVGNAVQVTGPSGPLELEPVQVAERSLVQPLPVDLPPGEYTVQWRAASGDGHPIEGTFAFTSTAAAPTSSAPAATTPASTSPSPSEPATSTSSSTTSDEAAAQDPVDPSGSSLPVWAGVGVALLAGAGVAVAALRRGRRPGEHA
jgi:copper resistance protein C